MAHNIMETGKMDLWRVMANIHGLMEINIVEDI